MPYINRVNGLISESFGETMQYPGQEYINNSDIEYNNFINKKDKYDKRTYLDKRKEEYGSAQEQFEYIVENGIDAFISKQNSIKVKYPKE